MLYLKIQIRQIRKRESDNSFGPVKINYCKMIIPELPKDEIKRQEALKGYSVLDSMAEEEYDNITFLASRICGTPISLISLIDDKRQWFKSHHGLDATETPKEFAFCAHAINDKNNIFIIPDSRKDERFHDNPLVINEPYVIFYAGIPLTNKEGFPLGTLCVIDNEPNSLDEFQIKALKALANQIIALFELRKKTFELETKTKEIEARNVVLKKFAGNAAHDIKSPLATIVMVADLFSHQYADQLDDQGMELLEMINKSALKLTNFIDGILEYSLNSGHLSGDKKTVNIRESLNELIQLIDPIGEVKFAFNFQSELTIYTNENALDQILLNLLVNAIKYNDKDPIRISIMVEDLKDYMKFNITDNGPGIKKEDQQRIFQIFETASTTDKSGVTGTGIGLAKVKSMVEGLGGTISLFSEIGEGADFGFTLRK